jgi:hypothetical protein
LSEGLAARYGDASPGGFIENQVAFNLFQDLFYGHPSSYDGESFRSAGLGALATKIALPAIDI